MSATLPGKWQNEAMQSPDHGPCLSLEEYEQRLVALYSDQPPMPTDAQDQELRRRQLDLSVDYRLGRDFPLERRAALWEIAQRVEKKRLRLVFWHTARRLVPGRLAAKANGLAGFMVDEYAKVLSSDEIERYFDLPTGTRPALPIDVGRK